ncbi:MAG: orotidine-5'-phosphate decarboxylase [Planctomycetes bacterium]|nr:orotidine-5'-phosphate decarboxylase [Planctomycetota bacterium]
MPPFIETLIAAVRRAGNPVLVGLDPRADSLPKGLLTAPNDPAAVARAFQNFCCGVIDAVATRVAAVKPQAAFFEQYGPPGMTALHEVIQYARQKELLVILDGKRNDIGTTAAAYAEAYLGRESVWGADALTVSPYLGDDSLEPFVTRAKESGSGIFVLVKTSNPGGGAFQDYAGAEGPLYRRVAACVERLARETESMHRYGAVGAVVGATYPEQLAELRSAMPQAWLLIPGFGAQGGSAEDVAAGFDSEGLGAIVNNSRGLIFAHAREPYRSRFGASRWQDAVAAATADMIDQLAAHTPAGQLRPH